MVTIKRSYINQLFTSLAGMMCFFLFAFQTNSQFFLPEDPSADVVDPVAIVARVVSSATLFGTEHLPVHQEEVSVVAYPPLKNQEFFSNRDPRPVVVFQLLPSLRGPPAV